MIVLDTNVVSESMRPEPDLSVRRWLNGQPPESLCLTAVTLAELLFGIGALPDGRPCDCQSLAKKCLAGCFRRI